MYPHSCGASSGHVIIAVSVNWLNRAITTSEVFGSERMSVAFMFNFESARIALMIFVAGNVRTVTRYETPGDVSFDNNVSMMSFAWTSRLALEQKQTNDSLDPNWIWRQELLLAEIWHL